MMFLQFTMVMYRNLPFQDRPFLLYDLSVSLLNDLRKMFNANYQYLLVIVSGEGGRGSFLALCGAAVFRPMPLL